MRHRPASKRERGEIFGSRGHMMAGFCVSLPPPPVPQEETHVTETQARAGTRASTPPPIDEQWWRALIGASRRCHSRCGFCPASRAWVGVVGTREAWPARCRWPDLDCRCVFVARRDDTERTRLQSRQWQHHWLVAAIVDANRRSLCTSRTSAKAAR